MRELPKFNDPSEIVCKPWREDYGEWFRDFAVEGPDDCYAAYVYLEENCTGEAPEPGKEWQWSASRHCLDEREDRRATDEEHEWIKSGLCASAEEGKRLADEALHAEGYTLKERKLRH